MVRLVLVRCQQRRGSTSTERFVIPDGMVESEALAKGLELAQGNAYYPEESRAWVAEFEALPTWAAAAPTLQ